MPDHGTRGRYSDHGCRCDPCKSGWSEYQRAYRERKKQTPFEKIPHGGVNGYAQYGCRCDKCKEASARAMKTFRLRNNYGISPSEYEALKEAQGGMCAICSESVSLVVDHDHLTGAVRGLLCSLCNSGIGMLRDREDLLQIAVFYLQDPPAGKLE